MENPLQLLIPGPYQSSSTGLILNIRRDTLIAFFPDFLLGIQELFDRT